jgi:hypothetical protein
LYPFKEYSSIKQDEPTAETEFKPPEDLTPPIEDQYTRAEKKTSPLGQAEQPSSQQEMDADAAFAGLEALAAQQGADEGTLATPPEDRSTSAPSWVLEQPAEPTQLTDASDLLDGAITLEEPSAQAQEQPLHEEPEPLPDWLKLDETPVAAQEKEPSDISPLARPDEPTEWVAEAATEPQWTPEPPAAAQPVQAESHEEPKAEEALPSWLQGFDQSPTEPQAESKVAAIEDLPDWLKDFETPAEAPLTQASDESISISTWLKDQPVDKDEQPAANQVTVEDTQPIKVPVVLPPTAAEPEPVSPETPVLGEPEKIKAESHSESDSPMLTQAQTAMQDGKIEQALNIYNSLIEQGQLLDEVVHDLRDSLYRYPVEIAIWQTLGDAYIRSNHIQEALDAYTKAEELLR